MSAAAGRVSTVIVAGRRAAAARVAATLKRTSANAERPLRIAISASTIHEASIGSVLKNARPEVSGAGASLGLGATWAGCTARSPRASTRCKRRGPMGCIVVPHPDAAINDCETVELNRNVPNSSATLSMSTLPLWRGPRARDLWLRSRALWGRSRALSPSTATGGACRSFFPEHACRGFADVDGALVLIVHEPRQCEHAGARRLVNLE